MSSRFSVPITGVVVVSGIYVGRLLDDSVEL